MFSTLGISALLEDGEVASAIRTRANQPRYRVPSDVMRQARTGRGIGGMIGGLIRVSESRRMYQDRYGNLDDWVWGWKEIEEEETRERIMGAQETEALETPDYAQFQEIDTNPAYTAQSKRRGETQMVREKRERAEAELSSWLSREGMLKGFHTKDLLSRMKGTWSSAPTNPFRGGPRRFGGGGRRGRGPRWGDEFGGGAYRWGGPRRLRR